jgi:flagellar biosynthesis GTPase FlhF
MAKNQQPAAAAAKPTLEDLRAASKEAAEKAALLKVEADKADATEEQKTAYTAADEAATAASQALTDAEAADAAEALKIQEKAQAEAQAKLNAAANAPAPDAVDEEDDPKYVPIFRDEDGERIERNRVLRLVTTTGQNLRALDGSLITPDPTCELNGFDVRKGDWYTVQYAAGLILVDSTKKAK